MNLRGCCYSSPRGFTLIDVTAGFPWAVRSLSVPQTRCTPSPRLRGEGGGEGDSLSTQCVESVAPPPTRLARRPLPPSGGGWSLRHAPCPYRSLLGARSKVPPARPRHVSHPGPSRGP